MYLQRDQILRITVLVLCIGVLITSSTAASSLFPPIGKVNRAQAQGSPTTDGPVGALFCSDGLPPYQDGTCPDGLPPQPKSMNETSDGIPAQSVVPLPGEQLLSNGTQAPGQIEMDLNGDGVVDEFESQNQPPPVSGEQQFTNGTQAPGQIEMDLNGDGVVDEFESQNQPPPVSGEQQFTNGTQAPGQIVGETTSGAAQTSALTSFNVDLHFFVALHTPL